jgi:hypothetical protein
VRELVHHRDRKLVLGCPGVEGVVVDDPLVNTPDQVGGSAVIRGDDDEKVASYVDPNTHGGIRESNGGKKRQ